jgi:hypothetical protein
VGPVGGIDVDQNGADLRRRELDDGPLRTIGRPDADPITVLDTECHQSAGNQIDICIQFAVAPPTTGCAFDQRFPVAVVRDDFLEVIADRLLQQRN